MAATKAAGGECPRVFFANKKGVVEVIDSTRNFVRLEMRCDQWCVVLSPALLLFSCCVASPFAL